MSKIKKDLTNREIDDVGNITQMIENIEKEIEKHKEVIRNLLIAKQNLKSIRKRLL